MTTLPGSTSVAPDADDLDYNAELRIAAPMERVFEALTTLSGLAGWWTGVSGSGEEGGELRFVFDAGDPCIMHVSSTAYPTAVHWTCLGYAPLADWGGTTVNFDLREDGRGGSVLTFVHHGLTPRLECFKDCKNGWDFFLLSLRSYVESGTGQPYGSSGDVHRRERREAGRGEAEQA